MSGWLNISVLTGWKHVVVGGRGSQDFAFGYIRAMIQAVNAELGLTG